MLASPVLERIRAEMKQARRMSEAYLRSSSLRAALYELAITAVGRVLKSLRELQTDSELMRCWKSEMMAQAVKLQDTVRKKL